MSGKKFSNRHTIVVRGLVRSRPRTVRTGLADTIEDNAVVNQGAPDEQHIGTAPPLKRFLVSPEFRNTVDDIESTLRWGMFLADPRVLESDRDRLKDYLEELLEGFDQRYFSKTILSFPGYIELQRLTEVVTALGKMLGVQKTGFGDLLSSMKRIENRWKISLIALADNLVERLCKVPASPRSIVRQVIKQCGGSEHGRKLLLEQIDNFLDSKNGPVDTNAPWESWYAALRALVFPGSFVSGRPPAEEPQRNFNAVLNSHGRLMAFLFFMDLRRLQAEWMIHYAEQTKASLHWIYDLQRPTDFVRLSQVYFGNALSPEELRTAMDTLGNRERRMRTYSKRNPRR